MTLESNMRINGNRLWDALMEMARIGPGVRGGNNRQTLTDEDAEGRKLFTRWCIRKCLICEVTNDIGNLNIRSGCIIIMVFFFASITRLSADCADFFKLPWVTSYNLDSALSSRSNTSVVSS